MSTVTNKSKLKKMAKQKITIKGHQEAANLRGQAVREMNSLKREDNWSEAKKIEANLAIWDEKYFNKLEKVFVSFCCGSRNFYREVTKVGNTLFSGKEKLNKSNGYWFVEIIPAITDKMREEMIADSYYY